MFCDNNNKLYIKWCGLLIYNKISNKELLQVTNIAHDSEMFIILGNCLT